MIRLNLIHASDGSSPPLRLVYYESSGFLALTASIDFVSNKSIPSVLPQSGLFACISCNCCKYPSRIFAEQIETGVMSLLQTTPHPWRAVGVDPLMGVDMKWSEQAKVKPTDGLGTQFLDWAGYRLRRGRASSPRRAGEAEFHRTLRISELPWMGAR
jgi:hypothetical protein